MVDLYFKYQIKVAYVVQITKGSQVFSQRREKVLILYETCRSNDDKAEPVLKILDFPWKQLHSIEWEDKRFTRKELSHE
jgi:hypothetical protein